MNTLIDTLAKSRGFHLFQKTENSCGFTTPQTFSCGKPACYYITQTPQNRLIIDDYGLNFNAFSRSLPNPDDAEKTMSRLVKQTTQNVRIEKHRLVCESSISGIDFAIGEYLNVLGRLVSYQPKTVDNQDIDGVISSIHDFLLLRHNSIIIEPKIKGLSGVEYTFAFQADNTFIDFAKPQTEKTGKLLRKIIDALNNNNNLNFQLVIDDQDQEAFKRESSILSTLASITPYSRITSSLH